jgi:hypothetical protein
MFSDKYFMTLTPRYLVKNRTTIITNDAGFITEYRPVYQRQLNVYRGISNVLEFRVLNADQKPVDLTGQVPKFQAYSEDKKLVITHDGVLTNINGLFKVTITENDLLNIKEQFLSYNVYLQSDTEQTLTYANSHFGNSSTMLINGDAFPGPLESKVITTFTETQVGSGSYVSEWISAEPGINGNEALHTAVIYSTGYAGNVTVEVSLDEQIINQSVWSVIKTVTLTGAETEPTPVNFNGVYSFLRFKATADPANKISKILVRN